MLHKELHERREYENEEIYSTSYTVKDNNDSRYAHKHTHIHTVQDNTRGQSGCEVRVQNIIGEKWKERAVDDGAPWIS